MAFAFFVLFLSLNWICVHKNKNTNKELTVRWMIESTKKRRQVGWLNQHKKKLPNRRKKKKKTILPLQQSFFLLDRSFNLSFFFCWVLWAQLQTTFFSLNCCDLPFVLRQVWFASPIVCVLKKKQLTESLQAKLSENSTKKKKKTTLLPSIECQLRKKKTLTSLLICQLLS